MDKNKNKERVSQAALTALNLSHGVKNIMQAIRGSREVIDRSMEINDIERAKRGWDILSENLDKIEKLILDMLQFSRESQLKIKKTDINSIVESAAVSLVAAAEGSGKKMLLTTDKNIEPIKVDPDKIYDCLLNLLLNAVDAAPKGTGEVKVTTEAKDKTVIITVSDNGPGIEDINSIFEPFHTTKARVGTGLGLPIAKKIIDQHEGTIVVKSKPGKGATFTVTLPMKQ